jgi:hypothetical protein
MDTRKLALTLAALGLTTTSALAQNLDLEKFGKEALKGIVVGAAVKATAGQLNDLLNAASGKHGGKIAQMTKVVPIVSVGEKGYAGAAQVAGPRDAVRQVKAVVQLESTKKIGGNLWRVKALVPSRSLNPGEFRRVDKVGLSALLDVALDGKPSSGRALRGLSGKDVLRGAALAAVVNANRAGIDRFAREVTGGRGSAPTRVVVSGTFGQAAWIGAAQVSGTASALSKINALWQWDDTLDRGRIRVRYLIPSDTLNPLKTRRLDGVGLTALIETSVVMAAGEPFPRQATPQERVAQERIGRRVPPGLAKKGGLPPGLAKKL